MFHYRPQITQASAEASSQQSYGSVTHWCCTIYHQESIQKSQSEETQEKAFPQADRRYVCARVFNLYSRFTVNLIKLHSYQVTYCFSQILHTVITPANNSQIEKCVCISYTEEENKHCDTEDSSDEVLEQRCTKATSKKSSQVTQAHN